MLIVSNSTVALSSLRLICGGEHSSIATISKSLLSVSNCEIRAAPSTSPFLSMWTPTYNSMLIVVDTQVNWKQPTSLPLFGTIPTSHKSLVTELSEDSLLGRETDQARGLLSIVGSGLTFANTAIPLATGPLFDFGFKSDNTQQSISAVSVSLTTSAMTNVTSRRRFISDTVRFPQVSQRVISLSMSNCTNHLYGTGSLDMNFGSSLCCLNSSFSHCETSEPTEGPPVVYLQHRATQFDRSQSPAFTTFDTCTFRVVHSGYGGGAIDSCDVGTSLSVTKCSFFRCTTGDSGGSIFFRPSPKTCPVTLSHCSFVSGSSPGYAGGVDLSDCEQGSITDCVFYDLLAEGDGGGLVLTESRTHTVTVSNCLFQKCRRVGGWGSGGAVFVWESGFTFTSLRFRENSAEVISEGHDLCVNQTTGTTAVSSFTDCDTDQEIIEVVFPKISISPNLEPTLNRLVVSSVTRLVSSDNRTAKATLTVDRQISGTVLVLVDNTDAYEMPNDDSPPPITRLVSFDFSSDSTSSESDLFFGEWEVLQYESNYSLVTFGWKESIVDTNGAILTTPNPPRIVRAMCEGGSSEFNTFFSLKGRTLATGSYKVTVKDISDFSMVVDFVNNPSGGNLFSTKAGLKLQGDDAILAFETTYEIDEVIEVTTSKVLILDPPRLFFTTPSPPILKSVGAVSFSDSKKDTITIKLVGEALFANPYSLTVTDGSTTSTLTAVFDADGVNGEATAVVYSMDGSKTIQLIFEKTYTITDITCSDNNQPTLIPNLHFDVPPEPARVEKVVSAALNDAKNEVEVTFRARALPPTITSVAIAEKDTSVFVSADRLSGTSFSALFNVDESDSSDSLQFGGTYLIASVSSGSDFLVCDDVTLKVPSNVRVKTIHPTFSNNVKTGLIFDLEVEGPIHDSKYKRTMNRRAM
ncbi:hypothetical protein BLNAU_16290 [Blattamonas nauphoetae]|uniref:Right handed beta helix domain-containing protein n=1 Tax=Blattamonas nauphoetae TaxID=2049346 RepID=A0ABQ9XBP7_9EUKA|nr:hypothetical protein BLNAU_16290 [Blattamonas nauphoetae]